MNENSSSQDLFFRVVRSIALINDAGGGGDRKHTFFSISVALLRPETDL